MKPTDFAGELAYFLGDYLPSQRNASPNTVKAYRDAFVLLIRHCGEKLGCPPARLTLRHFDVPLLLTFLEAMERERDCSVTTRNHRLAALHSFFRQLQTRRPECLLQCQQILSIPMKRQTQPLPRHLSVEEIKALLAQPGLRTRQGLRDTTLLAVLYDTGARVQEVADLNPAALRFGATSQVELTGKGRKQRVVPLLTPTSRLLSEYLAAFHRRERWTGPLFYNRSSGRLTRAGIGHILSKYAESAGDATPHFPGKVTPHILRHSKAMHLLHAGTPMPVVQAVLGHADIRTTTRYARASLEQMREALEKGPATMEGSSGDYPWHNDDGLLKWLKSM